MMMLVVLVASRAAATVWQTDELGGHGWYLVQSAFSIAIFDQNALSGLPTELAQSRLEPFRLVKWIAGRRIAGRQHADARNFARLLGLHGNQPRYGRSTEKIEKFPAPHVRPLA